MPSGVKGRSGRGLGAFGGVFVPSILTILGIILFLRLGFVVGNAGLPRALGILALASTISLLTSTSLAAIATNRKVRGGGDYYLISRSLGVEYGGALGLLLFAAQAVSVAFYCAGFGEALASIVPGADASFGALAAAAAVVVLLWIAWLGADLATRFQYAIMAVLFGALAVFFAGAFSAWDPALLRETRRAAPALPFWALFAIFFPAVTGFTQGVSMSGDLKDASRAIPRGTFSAVGLSTAIYLAAMVVLAGALPLDVLRGDSMALRQVSALPALVDAGVLAATLSSALASLLAAPRILQALASDGLFRFLAPFARGHGPLQNPRRGVLLSGAIALGALAAGGLDAIAALVSMFFLISYALLNYATYVEATGKSPSFRPTFRFFHRRASLAGTLLCGGAMLAIEPLAGVVALAILGASYQYLRRTAIPARWRDSRQAYRFQRAKEHLRDLASDGDAPRDWQPQVLAFTEGVQRRERLLRFAAWISGGSGVVTAVRILQGESWLESTDARRKEAEAALREEIAAAKVDAFPLVVAAADPGVAARTLVQAWGIGPIRSNTVLLNWIQASESDTGRDRPLRYGRVLRNALRLHQNLVVLDADGAEWKRIEETPPDERRIDVWWNDDGDSSRLALLFAYLMRRTEPWDEARIRVLTPVAEGRDEKVAASLSKRLEELRIEAEIEPVVDADAEAVAARSADSTLVFLPLRLEGMRIADPFGGECQPLLERLPIVALVGAAGAVSLAEEEAEPPAPVEGAKSEAEAEEKNE